MTIENNLINVSKITSSSYDVMRNIHRSLQNMSLDNLSSAFVIEDPVTFGSVSTVLLLANPLMRIMEQTNEPFFIQQL
jgi:hypothetical protein